MPLPYPIQSGINQFLIRQEFNTALDELEKQFPNNSILQNFRGDSNRIRESKLMGILTAQEIAAQQNLLASKIREWMNTVENIEIKKIIVFFNNAPNSLDIKLSKESGEIEGVFKNSLNTPFRLLINNHLDYDMIIDKIIREEPYFVQFSMHADGEKGLKMTDGNGNKRFIDKERFKGDMELITKAPYLRGIMLNGCHTQPVAESARGIIPRIIATKDEIGDKAARIFSSAFYHSLLYYPNSTIDSSFEVAVKKLNDNPDEDVKKNAVIPIII